MDKISKSSMDRIFAIRHDGTMIANMLHLCLLILTTIVISSQTGVGLVSNEPDHNNELPKDEFTCTTEDINHSVLVECGAISCPQRTQQDGPNVEWPSQLDEIVHVHSSRAGNRFAQNKLPNLDFKENDEARMLDINTTFYIKTPKFSDDKKRPKLTSFGATIDFLELARALRDGQFESTFGLIFDDLFGGTSQSTNLEVLRIQIDSKHSDEFDVNDILMKLDFELGKRHTSQSRDRLKVLPEFSSPVDSDSRLGIKSSITTALVNTELWAVSLDLTGSPYDRVKHQNILDRARQILPQNIPIFFTVDPVQAPFLVDDEKMLPRIQGLLVKSRPSNPYNYLSHVRRQLGPNKSLVIVGRTGPRTKSLGDWRNAYNTAIEIVSHLEHGADAFIESRSVLDVFYANENAQDAMLYNLHQDQSMHLRSPKFYALGHFSRYLKRGSVLLESELFTQPNMFAAHYTAFLSADRQHVIGIILNENEHLLPLRLAIDRRIKVAAYLEAKSFNTFLIKLSP
jgi:hypothetical protein